MTLVSPDRNYICIFVQGTIRAFKAKQIIPMFPVSLPPCLQTPLPQFCYWVNMVKE